jgi:hypothetical protein
VTLIRFREIVADFKAKVAESFERMLARTWAETAVA